MHNKTFISALGWLLSVGGWFLWNLVLAGLYKPSKTYPLYPIYRSFLDYYGRNLLWWLLVLLTLAALVVVELGVSSIRKTFWPTDTDVFQVLQKDSIIRKRFEETIRKEEEGSLSEVAMGSENKSSTDVQREDEIQDLLNRPRVMDLDGEGDVTVVRSPVDIGAETLPSRNGNSSHILTKRKFSVDVDDLGMGEREKVLPKTRHSVDIAEVLGRSS